MRTKVMGIVNVTPDSFSDGGQFFRPEEAIRRVKNIIEDGADIVDLGGESTRPGAAPIAWEEEWARVEPVLKAVRGWSCPISVDTYHPETAERAISCGARIINCVRSESVQAMLGLLNGNEVELVMPYRLGDDLARIQKMKDRVYLDPMIGFETTREQDLELLRSVPELAKIGRVLVGASRKRIVKKLTGEKMLGKNVGGNLGIAIWCALQGASVVRVHDVKETVQALRVVQTLAAGSQTKCVSLA